MSTNASGAPLSDSRFGFNYMPQGYKGCDFLTDDGWAEAKGKVAQDLDLMRSLGATVLRLPFWSPSSGFKPTWSVDTQMCRRLPDYLAMAKERGFKVVILLANTYQRMRGGELIWRIIYGSKFPNETDEELFERFVSDSLIWENGIIDLAESSSARDAVVYYDYTGEYTPSVPRESDYFRAIYSRSHVPAGKGGQSVLVAPDDLEGGWDTLVEQLAIAHGSISFVDFHAYPVMPHTGCPGNPDFKAVYDHVVAEAATKFPGARVVIGEFGRKALRGPQPFDNLPYPRTCRKQAGQAPARVFDERSQSATVMDIINWAAAKKIPIYTHWMLWDHTPANDTPESDLRSNVFGIGSDPDAPKDVLGLIATRFGILKNGDMETPETGAPADWRAQSSGDGPSTLQLAVSDRDPATNARFAHLETTDACNSCRVSIDSVPAKIAPGKALYVNAYVRTNMSDVRISVAQFDDAGHQLDDISGPSISPADGRWRSYLHQIDGGWRAQISPKARKIVVSIGGAPRGAPAYLDVDAVSASQ